MPIEYRITVKRTFSENEVIDMVHEGGKDSLEGESKPRVRVIAPIEGPETKAQMAPMEVSPTTARMCAYHPSLPAVYICANCSKPLCVSCGLPYGQLYLCPQCYQPPPSRQPQLIEGRLEQKKPKKPPMESILGICGGLAIIVGFFMPWAASEPGFVIAANYPEGTLVILMGILIVVVEIVLLFLYLYPMIEKKPPIGVRLLSLFLGFLAYIVLIEIVIKAEGLLNNINMGWFVCWIGANIMVAKGVLELWGHYKGDEE